MRFMIIVKANEDSETGVMPTEEMLDEMGRFHEELAKAGVLLDASGLHPTKEGWRITWSGGKKSVVDGPFAETKELVAGYSIIQVRSREEALQWTKRFPNPGLHDGTIEVRQLFELDEFEQGPAIERFREMSLPSQQ